MLSENRKYDFIAELTLHRSRVLDSQSQPNEDKVNWLFLNTGERQFSFVYKIETPLEANYDKPFKVEVAFTMGEVVKNVIQLNHAYEVLRGQEAIGAIELISALK